MEAVLFQIVRALATVFEITLAFALLNAMFEPKYASKWPLRLSYILLLAAVFSSSRWRCKRNPSAGWRRLTPTCASCATI